uniref:Uncharacterized protein AlNc14C338G10758 n=1 Tax=Albugo laibachii Nc14 TaxID=890382 RepID=F0WWZ7_9STRA|nr:conserved hypothetical protein [Albugo laibachii Nc14]|eukprot:CCA25983.1 conserved hypothetical protein [Albugo laibachii Nc14]
MQPTKKARVIVAHGWGTTDPTAGNVFCDDSRLRYIYEKESIKHMEASTRVKESHSYKQITANGSLDSVDYVMADMVKSCKWISERSKGFKCTSECVACLQEGALLEIRPCGHPLHPDCFLRWYRLNRSCPLCRGPAEKIEAVQGQDTFQESVMEVDLDARFSELIPDAGLVDRAIPEKESLEMKKDDFISFLDTADNVTWTEDVLMEDQNEEMSSSISDPTLLKSVETLQLLFPSSDESLKDDASFATCDYPPTTTIPNYWHVLSEDFGRSNRSGGIGGVNTSSMVKSRTGHDLSTLYPLGSSDRREDALEKNKVVSCRCSGGCRNGRCACVRENGMCTPACRCTSCQNPFSIVKAAGANMDILKNDSCFMQNACKGRVMKYRLQELLTLACCKRQISVMECLHGYTCMDCTSLFAPNNKLEYHYTFSWCTNKLLQAVKTPRRHCDICRRCTDHRDQHCNDCNRCYFAGVTGELPCSCQGYPSGSREIGADAIPFDHRTTPADEENDCTIM